MLFSYSGFSGNALQFSPFFYYWWYTVIESLYCLEIHSFCAYFLRTFIIKECWILWKVFPSIVDMIMWFSPIYVTNCICLIWLCWIILMPWNIANLIIVNYSLVVFLSLVCSILLRILYVYSSRRLGQKFFIVAIIHFILRQNLPL